mmetsp:Transcript_4727/g.16570  ORF Transcript_4727/g.16570 Transcript_4727/m.16570 type:complete len:230 (-) Transcript_4727:512-1201(-)
MSSSRPAGLDVVGGPSAFSPRALFGSYWTVSSLPRSARAPPRSPARSPPTRAHHQERDPPRTLASCGSATTSGCTTTRHSRRPTSAALPSFPSSASTRENTERWRPSSTGADRTRPPSRGRPWPPLGRSSGRSDLASPSGPASQRTSSRGCARRWAPRSSSARARSRAGIREWSGRWSGRSGGMGAPRAPSSRGAGAPPPFTTSKTSPLTSSPCLRRTRPSATGWGARL